MTEKTEDNVYRNTRADETPIQNRLAAGTLYAIWAEFYDNIDKMIYIL